MILKFVMCILAFAIIVSQAFAGGPPIEVFVTKVHDITGKSKKDIRRAAAEVLGELGGKYTPDELKRIGKGIDNEFDLSRTNETVGTLQDSPHFRAATGLDAVARSRLAQDTKKSFGAYANKVPGSKLELVAINAEAAAFTYAALERHISHARGNAGAGADRSIIAGIETRLAAAKDQLAAAKKSFIRAAAAALNQADIPYEIVGPANGLSLVIPYKVYATHADAAELALSTKPATKVTVHSDRIIEEAEFDSNTNTVFVGTSFLRRINKR